MKLIFLGNNLPLSLLIKSFCFCSYHHVGILVDDYVYEATAFHGVVKTPLREFKKKGRWAIVDIPVEHPERGINFLNCQIGKKYDWSGIWGLISKDRDWQNPDKWYCSELAVKAFELSGTKLLKPFVKGITPRDLWILPYPVVGMGKY